MKTRQPDPAHDVTAYVVAHQQLVYAFCYHALGDVKPAMAMAQQVLDTAWPPVGHAEGRAETLRLLRLAYDQAMRLGRDACPARAPGPATGGLAEPLEAPNLPGALATLPPAQRCLLALCCLCYVTPEEAGTVVGLDTDEVRRRLMAARRALARVLVPNRQVTAVPHHSVSWS